MGITHLPSFVRSRLLGLIHSTPRLRTHLLDYTASKSIKPVSTQAPEVVEAAFEDVFKKRSKLQLLHDLQLEEDVTSVRILQTAKEFCLPAEGESLLSGITMCDDSDSDVDTMFPQVGILPSTLFIRKFYPDLLNILLMYKYSILLGNPGISKSWFQWYILYRMLKQGSDCKFKLIARQVGQSNLSFIFPQSSKVFVTRHVNSGLYFLNWYIHKDLTLLLVEPESLLTEPRMFGVQTMLMCSPNDKRYKEFYKNGATKLYMPVWKLDELQLVAAHIRENVNDEFLNNALKPEEVEERYRRFGGIFRYVIPANLEALENAKTRQTNVLSHIKPVDVLIRGDDIERRDDNKDNISHFLLQYDVNMENFKSFTMMIASDHVQQHFDSKIMNISDLEMAIQCLRSMFIGSIPTRELLFEYVVYHMLQHSTFKWYASKGQEWVERKIELKSCKFVEKYNEKVLKDMEPGVLYRPANQKFVAVDMMWVQQNDSGQREYFCIQVTFAKKQNKKRSVYTKLYTNLGIKKEDRITIYFVTNPEYAKSYAKKTKEQFFSPQLEPDDEEFQNLECAVLYSKRFENGSWLHID